MKNFTQELFNKDQINLERLAEEEYLTIIQHLRNKGIISEEYEIPKLEVISKLEFFKKYYLGNVENLFHLLLSSFPLLHGIGYSLYSLLFRPLDIDNVLNIPNVYLFFPLLLISSLGLYSLMFSIRGIYLSDERKIQIIKRKDYLKNREELRGVEAHELCHDFIGEDEVRTETCAILIQYDLVSDKERFLRNLKKETTLINPLNLLRKIFSDKYYIGKEQALKVIANNNYINLKEEIEKLKNSLILEVRLRDLSDVKRIPGGLIIRKKQQFYYRKVFKD